MKKKNLALLTSVLLSAACLSSMTFSINLAEFERLYGTPETNEMAAQWVATHGGDANEFRRLLNGDSPTPSTPAPSRETGNTNVKGKKEAPNYPHDYPEITEEALTALSYFTKDGQPDSAYINITGSASENVIIGEVLNLSKTNKEDMVIRFVSENEIKSEWTFSNWESDGDYSLDLSSSLEKAEGDYPDTYTLSFNDGGTVSSAGLTYKVNIGVSDNEIHVYNRDGDNYEEIYSGKTDADGMLSLNPTELTEYTLSATDIIAEQKAEEERLKAEEEKKKADEEAKKAEEEAKAKESQKVEEVMPEASSEPAIENVFETEPEKDSFPVLPIAASVGIVLAILGVFIVKVLKR